MYDEINLYQLFRFPTIANYTGCRPDWKENWTAFRSSFVTFQKLIALKEYTKQSY